MSQSFKNLRPQLPCGLLLSVHALFTYSICPEATVSHAHRCEVRAMLVPRLTGVADAEL